MVGICRVFQTGIAELVEQEGDALVAVAAVGVAAVRQKTDQSLVQLNPLRRLRTVGGDRPLDTLDADGARTVAGQQQADQGLESEQVLGLRFLPEQRQIRDLGQLAAAQDLLIRDTAEAIGLVPISFD